MAWHNKYAHFHQKPEPTPNFALLSTAPLTSVPLPPKQRKKRGPAKPKTELAPLVSLIEQGRVFAVQEWIAEGKPVRACKGESPIRKAVCSGCHSMVEILLDCDLTKEEREDACWWAIRKDQLHIVLLMIEKGTDPNCVDFYEFFSSGSSVLITAAIARGLMPDMWTIRRALCRASDFEFIKRYRKRFSEVQIGADLALWDAVRDDKSETALKLLKVGANPRAMHRDRLSKRELPCTSTALENAVWSGLCEVVEAMKPSRELDDLDALLRSAVAVRAREMATYLIKRGARVADAASPDGLLGEAIENLNSELRCRTRYTDKVIDRVALAIELGARWYPSLEDGAALFEKILRRLTPPQVRRMQTLFEQPGAISTALYDAVFHSSKIQQWDKWRDEQRARRSKPVQVHKPPQV